VVLVSPTRRCDYATKEIKRANREDGLDIVPITVKELLEHKRVAI